MTSYVLIESRDPFESRSFAARCELAVELHCVGNDVVVMLIENGALAARAGAHQRDLESAARAGVAVFADEFALRERGIGSSDIASFVRPVPLSEVIQRLGVGARVLWS